VVGGTVVVGGAVDDTGREVELVRGVVVAVVARVDGGTVSPDSAAVPDPCGADVDGDDPGSGRPEHAAAITTMATAEEMRPGRNMATSVPRRYHAAAVASRRRCGRRPRDSIAADPRTA
jgi:hypothetical protein